MTTGTGSATLTDTLKNTMLNLDAAGTDKNNYDRLVREYRYISDAAMPFVFQEFQKTLADLGYALDTKIPHRTPNEMRDYLAKMHNILRQSKLQARIY